MSDKWIARINMDGKSVAELLLDGTWKSDSEFIRLYLSLHFDPKSATGVDLVMPFGRMVATRAAIKLNGQVEFSSKLSDLPKDAVS